MILNAYVAIGRRYGMLCCSEVVVWSLGSARGVSLYSFGISNLPHLFFFFSNSHLSPPPTHPPTPTWACKDRRSFEGRSTFFHLKWDLWGATRMRASFCRSFFQYRGLGPSWSTLAYVCRMWGKALYAGSLQYIPTKRTHPMPVVICENLETVLILIPGAVWNRHRYRCKENWSRKQ